MRIAWFSPFPPLKSGISDYSNLIINKLKQYADVSLWIDGYDIDEELKENFSVVDYIKEPDRLHLLSDYDIVVYNMGNNLIYHKNIFEVMNQYRGIVILHDYVMHHFFAGYWLEHKKEPVNYIREMEFNYGVEGKRIARDILDGKRHRIWETDKVLEYPLNKSVLSRAMGMIVHSEFVKGRLEHQNVIKLLHPFFTTDMKRMKKEELGLPDDRIVLFSLGGIFPHKRLDKVVSAIAGDMNIKKDVHFVVVGEKDNDFGRKFINLIDTINMNETVQTPGYLLIEKVWEYLSFSDVVVQLRYPTMGETSGAVLRAMYMGKPVMVTKTGWYDELPDDVVIKIGTDNEEEEIKGWLRRLIDEPELGSEIGARAKEYIIENYNSEQFCKGLIEFISFLKCQDFRYEFISGIGHEMSHMGVQPDDLLVNRVTDEIYRIIGDDESSQESSDSIPVHQRATSSLKNRFMYLKYLSSVGIDVIRKEGVKVFFLKLNSFLKRDFLQKKV